MALPPGVQFDRVEWVKGGVFCAYIIGDAGQWPVPLEVWGLAKGGKPGQEEQGHLGDVLLHS